MERIVECKHDCCDSRRFECIEENCETQKVCCECPSGMPIIERDEK